MWREDIKMEEVPEIVLKFRVSREREKKPLSPIYEQDYRGCSKIRERLLLKKENNRCITSVMYHRIVIIQ